MDRNGGLAAAANPAVVTPATIGQQQERQEAASASEVRGEVSGAALKSGDV